MFKAEDGGIKLRQSENLDRSNELDILLDHILLQAEDGD